MQAYAQEEPLEKELLVSLDIGYTTAYRDKSWVPVDVTVTNELKDLDGHVEVRLYDFSGNLQSPIYRVPAECPTDSRKRFRLYAYFNNTEKVEAWIYSGTRPALDVPAYQILSPTVAEGDLLGLILNEDALDFGFLYQAVQTPESELRFHRHNVATPLLGTLPEHISCYSAFNAVILGEIEPDRVPEDRRGLLRHYVRRGGTLIVMTGENAARYRGTWIEELAGVRIGETEQIKEGALAERLLPPDKREGVKPGRDCVLALIGPVADGAKVLGANSVLAVRRPLGRGHVYTLAIDGVSHALQDAPAYHVLWRQMISANPAAQSGFNTDAMVNFASGQIPRMTGVSMQPRLFVAAYLGSYLLIGIVANFLFWGRLKRREWAWVCLIAVSAGYTAFAYVYGTSGWAGQDQTFQIDTLRIARDEPVADYKGVFGILAAGSGNYTGTFSRDGMLINEVHGLQTGMYLYRDNIESPDPFTVVQGGADRFERMRVGASSLRFVSAEGMARVDGAIEGRLVLDASGLHGTFRNETGLALEKVQLLFNGTYFPVKDEDGIYSIALSIEGYRSHDNPDFKTYWPTAENADGPEWRSQMSALFSSVIAALAFSHGGLVDLRSGPDPLHGPYLVGLAKENVGTWETNRSESAKRAGYVVVAAEIEFENSLPGPYLLSAPLAQTWQQGARRGYDYSPVTLDSVRKWTQVKTTSGSPVMMQSILAAIPGSIVRLPGAGLRVEVYYRSTHPSTEVLLFEDRDDGEGMVESPSGFASDENAPALDVDPSGATWRAAFIIANPAFFPADEEHMASFRVGATSNGEELQLSYMAIVRVLIPTNETASDEEFTWR